jgi:hypothetical protein
MATQQQSTPLGDTSVPVTHLGRAKQETELKQPEGGARGKATLQEQSEAPRPHGDKWREVPIAAGQECTKGSEQQQQTTQQVPLKGKPEIEEELPSSLKQQQQKQVPSSGGVGSTVEQKECAKPIKPEKEAAVGTSPTGVGRELGDLKLLHEGHGEPPESYPSTFVQERVVARGLTEHNEPAVTKATPDNEIDYINSDESQSYKARLEMEGGHQRQA